MNFDKVLVYKLRNSDWFRSLTFTLYLPIVNLLIKEFSGNR